MKVCHRCGTHWDSLKKQPAVKETCAGCDAYLHCCLNCRFHEPAKPNQCAIPTTEWQADKTAANFCDEFEFLDGERQSESKGAEEHARQQFDALFGGRSEPTPGADAFKRLLGD